MNYSSTDLNRQSYILLLSLFQFILLVCYFGSSYSFADDSHDWRNDWAVKEGFTINIDTEGYKLPTSIAFVPNPGPGPKDPLYFITELRGQVRVVTNDRTIYTFAENFFKLKPFQEIPEIAGETGLAGICLDPEHGYVFVTFAYQDVNNILHNNIVRFDSRPGTFSEKPSSMVAFTEIFVDEITSPSHQIGPCQVYNNLLYVTVGDGYNFNNGQDINSLNGKIIRMTLDGKPSNSNPFYVDDGTTRARDYVWAYGFRNPFGLKIVDGRIFISENGNSSDRFLEVREGENYLWNGMDWSIGTKAAIVFAPSVCPVQLDFYPESLENFPDELRGKFYLVLSGELKTIGPDLHGSKSIVILDYGFKDEQMMAPPAYLLKYRGSGPQIIVGLGIGQDGIYFVPLLPDESGKSAVFKVSYDEDKAYPYTLNNETNVALLLESHECYACHNINGYGEGTFGPRINSGPMVEGIKAMINSRHYHDFVKQLDSLDVDPFNRYRDARREVLQQKGVDQVKVWLKYHMLEPRFDNPSSQMPNMGLTESEAELLADSFVTNIETQSAGNNISDITEHYLPHPRYRYYFYSFLLGALMSLSLIAVYVYMRKKRRLG